MKKLFVIAIALAALLGASGASAATTYIKLGVDDEEEGEGSFEYEYNYIYEASCSETGCSTTCKNWWTNRLPYDVYGTYAMIVKDGGSEYYQSDWDARADNGWEEDPDTGTMLTLGGDRVYYMEYYWEDSQEYWFTAVQNSANLS